MDINRYRVAVQASQTTRRCEDCNLFTRRLGPGGECPHCGEPVLASELADPAGTR
jgi:rRNA maturation endonuclease Nob1